MKKFGIFALAAAAMIATGAVPGAVTDTSRVAELSPRERGGIHNPQPWKSAELSERERGGVGNMKPWETAELTKRERGGIDNPWPWDPGHGRG